MIALAALGCRAASIEAGEQVPAPTTAAKLTVYSGGHVRAVLEERVNAFVKATGASVRYRTGGSGQMLAQCLARKGDVYVAADLRHIRTAEQRDLVAAKLPVAHHRLAILVAKGNPKRIRSLKDLAGPGMKVYVEDPRGCQVGAATQRLLARNGLKLPRPAATTDGKAPSLSSAPKLIQAGGLDAAIVWDSMAARLKGPLDVVAIPPEQNVAVNIVAVVFRFSDSKALAERFVLSLRDEGSRRAWARQGFAPGPCPTAAPPPPAEKDLKRGAERMIQASRGHLAPVYAPLAEQIVKDYGLADKEGVGIDLGSGPGTLIVELCKRTRLHWINADINPYFFAHFFRLAEVHGVAHRLSAVCADAQDLPFRDNYADVLVSRGSYHFWADRKKAFAEIYRVLKPGAIAYVGRGFSRNLPIETARRIRAGPGRRMGYDRDQKAAELRKLMAEVGIRTYRIHLPKAPGGEDVNYGIWIEIRKPISAEK